ncbi:hypothetical protein IMCC12053_920 [Celeribacter marinus]|uniref:Uncharacterized protein n=1 Tax=Celeribacter marinus TaxID=1397108 RepID=A0A0P0A3B9_9RHOB|nr:hypothetical protein IMCC12053_920 [Celeribacter marinus]
MICARINHKTGHLPLSVAICETFFRTTPAAPITRHQDAATKDTRL